MEEQRNKKNTQNITHILEKCPMFQGIDTTGLHTIYREFRRKEVICDMVDGIACIGVIGFGEADVYTVSDEMTQPNVSTQHAGSIFGICNVFLPFAMPTRLVCRVSCGVVFIPKEEFRQLIYERQELLNRYLVLCNEKILYLAQKIELMGITSCKGKVACFLLRNADESGGILLQTSKEQFAKYLNVSRASLFRTIAEFTEQKLISVKNTKFQILDKEGLRIAGKS